MSKGRYLAEFELYVMLALARLEDSAYGVTIRQEIEERAGRSVLRYRGRRRIVLSQVRLRRLRRCSPGRRGNRWPYRSSSLVPRSSPISRYRSFD